MGSNFQEKLARNHVDQKLNDYKKFMGIENMPSYTIHFKKINAIKDSIRASHKYILETGEHKLTIPIDICDYSDSFDYILFHEFTHLYDAMEYSTGDNLLMAKNRAFTEYHASQIEMLKLLEMKCILDKPSFSVSNTILSTILGDKTVLQYIKEELEGIQNLISNKKFPEDIKELSKVLGIIFNCLGRISICRMYGSDYAIYKKELENMEFLKSYFGEKILEIISNMQGFLDEKTKNKIGELNLAILEEQIRKWRL